MEQQSKKILVVEDESIIRELYAQQLSEQGFAVVQAKNGQEGLDVAFREKPDLILLDILMPVMDGMAMMKQLRQDEWGKQVPIILLTNLSASEEIIKGMVEDKPLFFLVKSDWHINQVVEKIKQII